MKKREKLEKKREHMEKREIAIWHIVVEWSDDNNSQTHGMDVSGHEESIGEGPKFGGFLQIPQFKIDMCHVRVLHIFLNIDPCLMIFVPLESCDWEFSNGPNFIKNWYILRKVWRNRNNIIANRRSAYLLCCRGFGVRPGRPGPARPCHAVTLSRTSG